MSFLKRDLVKFIKRERTRKMTNSYDNDEWKQAKNNELFERAEYNYARQQRDTWEHHREERAKDPQYSRQEYENDNVISYELGQREVEARNRYENAQTKRLEIEQRQNDEMSRQNEQNHGHDDNREKDNDQSQHKDNAQDRDNDKNQEHSREQQQQKEREKEMDRSR